MLFHRKSLEKCSGLSPDHADGGRPLFYSVCVGLHARIISSIFNMAAVFWDEQYAIPFSLLPDKQTFPYLAFCTPVIVVFYELPIRHHICNEVFEILIAEAHAYRNLIILFKIYVMRKQQVPNPPWESHEKCLS